MAWRDMTAAEMIAATDSIAPSREVLEAEPELIALIPRLFAGADALAAYQRRVGQQAQQAQALTRRCEVKDIRRDACHRAAYLLLQADQAAATSDAEAAQVAEAVAAVYPDGLIINRITYQAQSGRDKMIAQALSPRLRAYLSGLRVTSHTALQLIEEAIALGPEIAALALQRNGLLKAEDPSAVTAGEVYALRLAWVQVISVMESLLPMTTLTAPQIEAAFGPAREAAAEAGKRAPRNN